MKTTYVIDWDVAKEELTKEEFLILNILVGKIQDSYGELSAEDSEDEFRELCDLPPLHHFDVFIRNGQEEQLNTFVIATDESDAVTSWYNKNDLNGELMYHKSHNLWTYNGCKIHLERV